MKITTTSGRWSLIISAAWFFAQTTFAAVQISENFDTNWPGAPWSATLFANVTNPVSGWSINSNSIAASGSSWYTTPSNSCFMGKLVNGQAWLKSPYLTNGIGSVLFDAKGSASFDGLLAFESSYDGTSWFTNLVTTNRLGSWTGYTNSINSMSNHFLRIRRLDNNNFNFPIDTVRITYPTPLITINPVTASPTRPTDQDPVTVLANVFIQSVADTFSLTNYWREWPSTNWNLIAMSSNAASLYTSDSNIPGKSIGALIEYHARATYTADGAAYTTNSITNNYVVLPNSYYTNLAVTGQVAAPLRNGADYQWQGVIQVTNINPTFKFQGISNAVTTTWGDADQSITNIPLYGQVEVTNSNITLYTAETGYYLFSLNETNLDYSVRSCSYENFDTWTNADTFTPPHTNSAGWILFSGNTSNDFARAFAGTGSSAVVETNGWVQSPYLTNGVGQISFWYRNWQTAGSSAGAFQIQTSSNAINWTILANGSLSSIISTNYLFFSVATSDPVSKYVRILNTNTATRLCLDEVAIVPPGAGVTAANLSSTPANPTILNPISISVDLTPYNGALISNNVTAWYRADTNGIWDTAAMSTTDGVHYVMNAPITGVPTGTLYYAVQYFFSGFQASSPAFFPAGGTNSPNTLSVSMPVDNRQENFDTNWPGAPWSATLFANVTNPVSGWSIRSNSIAASGSSWYTSPSNSCFLGKLMNGQAWLKSPYLTNGIGSVFFDAKGSASFDGILSFESSYDGTSWSTHLVTTNRFGSWLGYTNTINSISNHYLRIRRLDNNNFNFPLDTIRITYPPANVAITNITIAPGYPVAGQAFTASCDVITLNPYFPAYNIAPYFSYWTVGGLTTGLMTRSWVSGSTNHYTLPISLGSVTRDTPFNYYVRTFFSGYYGSTTENQSPRTSATNTFIVRAYTSLYGNGGIAVNGSSTTGRLLTNNVWQTIFNTPPTTNLSFTIFGNGYSSGSGISTNTSQWGNTNMWQTTLPLADTATTGQTAFAINGSFSGQYVLRFDETTGQYIIMKCLWQDFDNWVGSGGLYKWEVNDSTAPLANNFNNWQTNQTQVRTENFDSINWAGIFSYTNVGIGGTIQCAIFNSRINSGSSETTNSASKGNSFVVQSSRYPTIDSLAQPPLQGIGTVSFRYRASIPSTNTIGIFYPSNPINNALDYFSDVYWVPLSTSFIAADSSFATKTYAINTNATLDIIISHLSGSNTVFFDDVSVGEWYADSQTNTGWVSSEGWIEPRVGQVSNNCIRFDSTRADNGIEQFVMTPMLSNGVNAISFSYCAASSNSSISFNIESRTGLFGAWSSLTSMTDSNFVGNAQDYRTYSWTVDTSVTNTYLRILHTTNTTGVLLIDDIKVGGTPGATVWGINNAAIDDTDQPLPPLAVGKRQFYSGACYINSNRTSNLATGSTFPFTNTWPYIVSPIINDGVGEISFWYRNWATNGTPTPARLIIQTTTNTPTLLGTTDNAIWVTVDTITNIVNTNDYAYYQYTVNNSDARHVRIYNDDQYTNRVGRVCIDDFLVAAPLAASLSMSNLVITPTIPLYSNTVTIAADIFKLFLAPSNITLTAYYATATTYAALSAATPIPLGMTCIASNPSTPGQWYRFQTVTPIPTNDIDTFVKYFVQASFAGYQAASSSPKTLSTFNSYPKWYAPMDQVYTNNLAYYVVYSCPTGAVWFNELNVADFTDDWLTYIFTNEFIELCGPSSASIKNWTLELVDASAVPVASYTITNNPVLHSPTNGHGFWLIGSSNIVSRDQTFTANVIEDLGGMPFIGAQKMPYVYGGGLKLKRSWGPIEQLLFYNAAAPSGYESAGSDGWNFPAGSIGLTGAGTNKNDFYWNEFDTPSAGSQNAGQLFLGIVIASTPPVIYIYKFGINTNLWIECTQTSNWYTTPWYSTNLLLTNWTTVPSFTRSMNGTNDIISFNIPSNNTAYFYKIVATNAP